MRLANQLARQELEEISRAVRALLARPLLTASDDEETFDIVRRRRDALAAWFDYYCGWRLWVEPRLGYARLAKVRTDLDLARPARRHRSGRAAFDRRRYALLCVIAAELLAAPVTTIGLLADRVVQATATDPQLRTYDASRRDERSAFVDGLKLLEHYGVLESSDGSTETYLEHEDAKVLYRVDLTRLHRLLAAPVPPSRVDLEPDTGWTDRLAAIGAEARYGSPSTMDGVSETQRNLWLRHSTLRRLLDDPVVHRDELSPDQLGYITTPTGRRIVREAAERAGFELEERSEGMLLVDPDGLATDERFPDDRATAKVAALLLLDHLVAAADGLTHQELVEHARTRLDRKPEWAKTYQSDGGATRMTDDALAVLHAFGLAENRTDPTSGRSTVLARPAAHRYTVETADTVEEAQ